MINYDKSEIKSQLSQEDIYDLLLEFQGNPTYTSGGIISDTICHNKPGDGSHKLYYYYNSELFNCYTGGCENHSFDIFELVRKIANIQWGKTYDLNDAVRWIAYRFGISGSFEEDNQDMPEDWDIFLNYSNRKEVQDIKRAIPKIDTINDNIAKNLKTSLYIAPWIRDGISQEVINYTDIGYYLTTDQITIPHYDKDGNLIGIRGRTLCKEEAELYGKYRPLKVGNKLYNHPLGYNLYGLNWSKDNIKKVKTAIIAEGEKSVLQYMSFFGIKNDICVATCGSSISTYQMNLLLELGVQEVIIAYDRQFKEIGDDEYKKWIKKLKSISEKFGNQCNISFIFDNKNLLGYKDSPFDKGKEVFLKLFSSRLDSEGREYK